jgi:Domain of unknown function (DUF1841)
MPFFHDQSRDQLRQMYIEAWRKRRERLPAEPLEAQIADLIELHPEYQAALEDPDRVLDRDYSPESGQSNPFLHMGLHLAIREQVGTDRPAGIRQAYIGIARRLGSEHDAEHQMIELLAQAMWEAQRSGLPPDENRYLEQIRRLARA